MKNLDKVSCLLVVSNAKYIATLPSPSTVSLLIVKHCLNVVNVVSSQLSLRRAGQPIYLRGSISVGNFKNISLSQNT